MGRPLIYLCGDSITYGSHASSPENTYPAALARMLAGRAEAEAFGSSGATLTGPLGGVNEGRAYQEREAYQRSLLGAPDYVVLMLGVNDANPDKGLPVQNGGVMGQEAGKAYAEAAEGILGRYQALPSHPRLFFCLATPFYRFPGMAAAGRAGGVYEKAYVDRFRRNLDYLRPLQARVAKKAGAALIDTYTPLRDEAYFSDGVHLNDRGYFTLAGLVYTALFPFLFSD